MLRILKAGENFSRLLLILPTCYISVERVFNAAGDGIRVVHKPVASYSENHNSARSAEQGIGCVLSPARAGEQNVPSYI